MLCSEFSVGLTSYQFHLSMNGLGIEDRQILLALSSSQMTKVYTHPNFELASKFVNKIPLYGKSV